jgi:uncharacterized OB-fold protein
LSDEPEDPKRVICVICGEEIEESEEVEVTGVIVHFACASFPADGKLVLKQEDEHDDPYDL